MNSGYRDVVKLSSPGWALLLTAFAAAAQAPAGGVMSRELAIQRGQQATGAAYRELQQVQREAKLAEQDFLNAQEAQREAQQRSDETKRKLDAAKKALDTARQKEVLARKRYDEALSSVDQAFREPPAKQ